MADLPKHRPDDWGEKMVLLKMQKLVFNVRSKGARTRGRRPAANTRA
jgi:hypothetical protein